jgi:hypothetical protein
MKRILRTLAFTGILGLAAAGAQAQVRAYIGFGGSAAVVAVPPCPGVGYVWTAGYYNGPVWVPGRWAYRGGYDRYDAHRVYDHDGWRGYDRDHDSYRGHNGSRGDHR